MTSSTQLRPVDVLLSPAGRRSSRTPRLTCLAVRPRFSGMTVANNELTAVTEGKQTVNGMLAKVQEAANEALG